jgi:hypothetical protein
MRFLRWSLLLGVVGCAQILGIEDLPRGTDTTAPSLDGGLAYANAACGTCAASRCEGPRAACLADPACAETYGAVAKCPPSEPLCRAQAEASFASGAATDVYRALDACTRDQCVEPCVGLGGFGALLDRACGCIDGACNAEIRACVRSGLGEGGPIGACERRLACIGRAPDPDNYVSCVKNDLGAPEATAFVDCARKQVCESCALADGALACNASFQYGRSRDPRSRFGLQVADALDTDIPIPNAKVRVCAAGCGACLPNAPVVETDPKGKVFLDLPLTGGAFDGCIEVTPKDPDGDKMLPTLVHPGRKIYQDEDLLQTFAITASVLDTYASIVGATVLAERGHVVGTLHDCLWGRIRGATVETALADDKTVFAYLDNASLSNEKSTPASGAFAILNLPPGRHTVLARKGGVLVGRIDVQVRAGTVADANVYPVDRTAAQ